MAQSNVRNVLAITLKAPWASAVIELGKNVESRTWRTSHRGLLAIHAGKGVDVSADALVVGSALRQRVPRGHVVAVVELRDVVRDSDSRWARPGMYHWLLHNVRALTVPVPCMGRQMLFTLPPDVEQAVLHGLLPPATGVSSVT